MWSLRAGMVFTVDGPPMPGGTLRVRGERLAQVSPYSSDSPTYDFPHMAILPGLVNAHTHLEFSHLDVPLGQPGMGFTDWIRTVLSHRRTESVPKSEAIAAGVQESLRHGVTAVGEIASPPYEIDTLSRGSLEATVFGELIGWSRERFAESMQAWEPFRDQDAQEESWQFGLSPHAPYSVSLENTLTAVEKHRKCMPYAMHLAESAEEMRFLETASGPFRALLEELGIWRENLFSGGRTPLDYLSVLARADRFLCIHGNFLSEEEIDFLSQHREKAGVVFCPRTHAYFEHLRHPLPELLRAHVPVALGTDSRASNPDLNLLAEIDLVVRSFPQVSPQTVLEMGTRTGAQLLGREGQMGNLAPRKLANFTVIRWPESPSKDAHEAIFQDGLPEVVATVIRGKPVFDVEGLFSDG